MEPGGQRRGPGPSDTPVHEPVAAAQVCTLEDLAGLLRDLRRRHARGRRDRSLTYRELAAKTGWSQTAIAEYFTARTLPPTDRFDALVDVLGAAPAERRALADARDRVEEAGRRARGGRGGGRRAGGGSGSHSPGSVAGSPVGVSDGGVRTVPCQLPAAPRLFTGRAAELARLDAALDARSDVGGVLVISAIGGSGGVGKTWLALHWAHERLERFPDGQLYVNLRGFDPVGEPLAPAYVLRGFLQSLGVATGAIPGELDAQAGLYRSLLAGKRMLVVLDNARDAAQVVALLPGGSGCTVLITSRRDLTALVATHGAHPVGLDVLSGDEARELLVRHLGRARLESESDATDTLLECCAGLPLALGIVTARAAAHPHLPLRDLAAELHGRAHRLDALGVGEPHADLRAVLSWSTRALSSDAAGAFGLLGVAPGPDIALSAAACLLGQPVAATRSVLCELERAHLIARQVPDRYRMHDLLRLHAAELARDQLASAEWEAAVRRLVDFYVRTAYAGGRLLAPQHPAPAFPGVPVAGDGQVGEAHALADAGSAAVWFDAEHACLLAAQQAALSWGWDAEVCHLAWALDPYHRRRGRLDEQAVSWQRAAVSARRLDDPAVRIQAQRLLGEAFAQVGRTGDALEQLHGALALAESAGDVAGQADIHHGLGRAWELEGDDRRALEHAHRALSIFRELGSTFQQARALNGVGWLQTRLGEYAEARAHCEEALALLRRHHGGGRQPGESNTLDSLGYIAHRLGEYEQAVDYYRRALAICRAQGDRYLEADVLDHIAETRRAQCRSEQARRNWVRALELYDAQHRLAAAERVRRRIASSEWSRAAGRRDA